MPSTINISDIRLFNLIKTKFGEKEAEEFVALVKEEIEETVAAKHEFVTKDIANLRDDLVNHFASGEFVEKKISEAEEKISNVEIKLSNKISEVEVKLANKISEVEVKPANKISGVETKISEAKFQIFLGAFVFWVTQLGAIFTFLNFFISR